MVLSASSNGLANSLSESSGETPSKPTPTYAPGKFTCGSVAFGR
ncbi:MAG: hypothetical protein CM15mP34_1370 [Gammaproteobacteria bacterium]|nr:MAG: hypothetical protein CM15mP34_1370 [Gammaproteobacteria bacterium]